MISVIMHIKEKDLMEYINEIPLIFQIMQDEALEIKDLSFGSVGKIFSGSGVESVWVKQHGEQIDPD